MNSENLIMISGTGVERWTINKSKLVVNEASLMESLARSVSRRCAAVANIGGPYGMAGVSIKPNWEFWTVQVLTLSFECPFYLQDGVHSPAFGDASQPTIKLDWMAEMKVFLAISVQVSSKLRTPGDRYLLAVDARGNLWRLPVSNLYEDGKLCHGQPALKFSSAMECVLDCCKRFSNSIWNHDLYQVSDDKRFQSTRDMFRWKPEEKGFKQLPMLTASGKDWTSLCMKIANDTIQQQLVTT